MAAKADAIFTFKQFAVHHGASTMRVGTDAVLLGAWCRVTGAHRVLDVGTGCGVIALMVAQRTGLATMIEAIDIDAASVREAASNFAASPWSTRLHAAVADYNGMSARIGDDESFDLIVSNPPFFVGGIVSPSAARAQARHTGTLTHAQLIGQARELLTPGGILAMVTPVEARQAIIEAATFASMHMSRICEVTPVDGRGVKRLLWEFTPAHTSLNRESITLNDNQGTPTAAYRTLCGDFYL